MMTEEEIKQAVRQAYLDGLREGFHLGLKRALKEDKEEAIEELKSADHYAETFFIKEKLLKSKKFL